MTFAAGRRGSRATRARRSAEVTGSTKPGGPRLDQHVAESGGLDGPASTVRPVRSAVSWQSRAFWLPPPTTWTTSIPRPHSRCGLVEASSVRRPPGSPGWSGRTRPGVAGAGSPASVHSVGDPGRHVARSQQAGVVGVEDRHRRTHLRGRLEQFRQVDRSPGALPGAHRLTEQPQAHHVLQVADPAVDAALVGEVGRPALLGQHRRIQLDADQGPGAGGDVRRVVGDHRHRDHRRGRVVRAHGHHVEPGRADLGRDRRVQRPDPVGQGRRAAGSSRAADRARRSAPAFQSPGTWDPTDRWWRRWSARRLARRSARRPAGPG